MENFFARGTSVNRLTFLLQLLMIILVGCDSSENESENPAVCFIGDSITKQWDLERYFPQYKINKHAVSGAGLERIAEWDLSDCKGIPAVMLMGTNNLKWGMEGDTLANWFYRDFSAMYVKIADTLGASKLHVVSILPRQNEKWCTGVINAEIEKANIRLKSALDQSEVTFSFINAFDLFVDKNYQIKKKLYKDGLHLSEAGFVVLAREVQNDL